MLETVDDLQRRLRASVDNESHSAEMVYVLQVCLGGVVVGGGGFGGGGGVGAMEFDMRSMEGVFGLVALMFDTMLFATIHSPPGARE